MKIALTQIKQSIANLFGYYPSNVKSCSDEYAWARDVEKPRENLAQVGKDLGKAIDKLSSIL